MLIERPDWIRAWTAHPPADVKTLAERLAANCEVRLAALPQAGLGLLTVNDGAFAEPYFLGEFPLSTCSVEIMRADGRCAKGGAQVMADDAELARALAVLDGLLAARLPGWEEAAALLDAGARLRADEDGRRRAMLAATRVDFAMLNNTGDADDDDEN